MFSRFRNLFSKNKNDSEVETEVDTSCGISDSYADGTSKSPEVNDTSEESSKLEGLNLLKSIVESEQQCQNNDLVEGDTEASASLSEEVAELLKKRLSNGEEKLKEGINSLGESAINESDIVEENGVQKEESENADINKENLSKDKGKISDNMEVSESKSNENYVAQENGNVKEESKNIKDSEEYKNNRETSNKNVVSFNLVQYQMESGSEIAVEHNDSLENSPKDFSQISNKAEAENISAPNDTERKSDELNSNEVKFAQKDSAESEKANKEENEQKISEATDLEKVNGTNEPVGLHISENGKQTFFSEYNEVSEFSAEKEKNEEVSEQNTSAETKNYSLQSDNEVSELSYEKKENISEFSESQNLNKSQKSSEFNTTETEDSSVQNYNEGSELSDKKKKNISERSDIDNIKKTLEENSEQKTLDATSFQNDNEFSELSDEKIGNISETSDVENLKKTGEPKEFYINEENSEERTSENPKDSIIQNHNEGSELSEPISQSNQFYPKTNETYSSSPFENKETLENITLELKESPKNSSETKLENVVGPSQIQQPNENNKSNISESSKIETSADTSRDNSPELSESSRSLSQSSVKEILANSASPTPSQDLATNLWNNSSIVVEDLPSEITTPTPTVDSTISGGSSNTSTLDSSPLNEIHDPSKIIVNPIDNNGLACYAITNKLTDIAEVAESLDATIREVQENVQETEVESNTSPNDKKLDTLMSTSSEDWHSRSTEDDSFATASEGNFTPHSHSSASFLTASGRTSSFISCDKNSFDASEADDSTYNFEIPELTPSLNMSFEGSEQSYLSAQQLNSNLTCEYKEKTPTKLSEKSSQTAQSLEDQSSIADVEDLHSECATPTPEDHYDAYHVESIPIESETELEVAGIANAPSLEITTEHSAMPMSKTPEVSPSTSNACSNQNPINTQISVNETRDSNDQQEQQNTNNNNNNKQNAAWRRSSYYENITKQTIKGFL